MHNVGRTKKVRAMVPGEFYRAQNWVDEVRARAACGLPGKAVLLNGLDRSTAMGLQELLCGPPGEPVNVLDMGLETQFDLIIPHVSKALLEMAEQGLLDGVVAWPPSSTWAASRVRGRAAGAPFLRVRGDHTWRLPTLRGVGRLLVAGKNAIAIIVGGIMNRVLSSG